jgi:hypothetical protein
MRAVITKAEQPPKARLGKAARGLPIIMASQALGVRDLTDNDLDDVRFFNAIAVAAISATCKISKRRGEREL